MPNILVRAAKGIGDALIMLIASETLRQEGHTVTTMTPHHTALAPLFPHHTFLPYGPLDPSFEQIILQNDNTSLDFIRTDRKRLHIYYPTYDTKRHPPLSKKDIAFDPTLSMVKNVMRAVKASRPDNGLTLPPGLIKYKHPDRILLHPSSADPEHIYPLHKMLRLGQRLLKQGFDVHLIVAPHERAAYLNHGFPVQALPLFDLAAFIYESGALIGNESGPAHLASNLGIPATMIASCHKRLQLWRPDFTPAEVLTPPAWLPKPLRRHYWHCFIKSPKFVGGREGRSDRSHSEEDPLP